MELTPQICYQAVLSHDHRFDGLFFTCVKSTGIYCRPICAAIVPKLKNCTFVTTGAAAEKAGYRPCLRCRPEHAPANAQDTSSIVHRIAAHIDETLLMDETFAAVARRFAISDRHMRRLFMQTFGVDPKQYLTTRRLLFAKQLLQDTKLPIIQVAYSAGFSTPGRLTINMKHAYGFTPAELRRETPIVSDVAPLTLRADYRPPFNWPALLHFIQGRATPLEWVSDGKTYHRMVKGYEITVTDMPDKNYLRINIPVELSLQAHTILRKVRKLFDLDANPVIIEAALSRDTFLNELIKEHSGLRVPGCWDSFEMLLRVIIGQQVSVAGATTVMRRLVERIGSTADIIAASSPETIMAIGMPLKRATTIWTIATMVHSGALDLEESEPKQFYDQLVAVPGIGSWTAEYMCMRVLRWPDAFPAGDLGLQKAAVPGQRQTERQLLARAVEWQPWRSYATILLWRSLENQGG